MKKLIVILAVIALGFTNLLNAQNISTIAGSGSTGYSGDGGLATAAKFSRVLGLAIDKHGNVYIGDWDNGRIRKVDAVTKIITTVVGNGIVGYSGDGGLATNAKIDKNTDSCMTYMYLG